MKKIFSTISALVLLAGSTQAQEVVYPARETKGKIYITNGTVHVGNGTVIENATIEISNGKIVNVGAGITASTGSNTLVVDAKGKHVYPGLILPSSDLGLKEIGAGVRGSNDFAEIGEYNTSIRSLQVEISAVKPYSMAISAMPVMPLQKLIMVLHVAIVMAMIS